MTVSFIFIMDILGTIAFAISGAMVAIEKKMDIFGVNILAITTATGGGVIRDLLIGRTPPVMFSNPLYVFIAILTANVVFCMLYFNRKHIGKEFIPIYERILFLCDALGLAAFTVDGVAAGMETQYAKNLFLLAFLGTVTGVGGGVIRDILALKMPYIFVKHIYACASLLGALMTAVLWNVCGQNVAMLVGFGVTLTIRALAAHYKWNLPRVSQEK